jgi:hypothetical protein
MKVVWIEICEVSSAETEEKVRLCQKEGSKKEE